MPSCHHCDGRDRRNNEESDRRKKQSCNDHRSFDTTARKLSLTICSLDIEIANCSLAPMTGCLQSILIAIALPFP